MNCDSTVKGGSDFMEGQDIFHVGTDGCLYFGIVVEVDPDSSQCLVRFGDATEKWSPFFDLKRLGEEENDPHSTPEDPQNGQNGQNGHDGAKKGVNRVQEARKELSYDFDSLIWDKYHQRNVQERYCYCGESGDWYKKMLQCKQCQQWFHQECIRNNISTNLLLGDAFWDFTCVLCTGTHEEIIHRLDINWAEAIHLALFNLTILNSKKYHDIETAIIPFFKSKWKYFLGPNAIISKSKASPSYIQSVLKANKNLFKCGSEIKKKSTFWGLRKVVPPLSRGISEKPFSKLYNNHHHHLPSASSSIFKKFSSRNSKLKPRDSFDSDITNNRGTLNSFIPIPSNFEGVNNPFCNDIKGLSGRPPSPGSNPPEQPPNGKGIFLDDLKLSSIFGAETRISKGETFNVVARRLTINGDIQYLINWERDNFKSSPTDTSTTTTTTPIELNN